MMAPWTSQSDQLRSLLTQAEQRFSVITEHRLPLNDPISKSRSANVQPDYAVVPFVPDNSTQTYAVLESKQYKKPSFKNFRAAAVDYARACSGAKIIISVYGPIAKEMIDRIRQGYEDQVEVLGEVHPGKPDAIGCIQRLLSASVPMSWRNLPKGLVSADVEFIAVDVSASMADVLRLKTTHEELLALSRCFPKAELLAVDVTLQSRERGPQALEKILSSNMRNGTNLASALSEIPVDRLLLITDQTGSADLGDRITPLAVGIASEDGIIWAYGERSLNVE